MTTICTYCQGLGDLLGPIPSETSEDALGYKPCLRCGGRGIESNGEAPRASKHVLKPKSNPMNAALAAFLKAYHKCSKHLERS